MIKQILLKNRMVLRGHDNVLDPFQIRKVKIEQTLCVAQVHELGDCLKI